MEVETTALSIKHIAQMYCVNGKYFADLYRNKISGYADWCEEELSGGFYFNAANIGPYMSLDETCLSNGEVWTFLTNKDGRGGRGDTGSRHTRDEERRDHINIDWSNGQVAQTQGEGGYL